MRAEPYMVYARVLSASMDMSSTNRGLDRFEAGETGNQKTRARSQLK
jgi:hypothetical protein